MQRAIRFKRPLRDIPARVPDSKPATFGRTSEPRVIDDLPQFSVDRRAPELTTFAQELAQFLAFAGEREGLKEVYA